MIIFAQLQRSSAIFRSLDFRRPNPTGAPERVRRGIPQWIGGGLSCVARCPDAAPNQGRLTRPRTAPDIGENPSRLKGEGHHADQNFTDFESRLAVRAVIIRASLRPGEFHVERPVQRRCRTIDRGGNLGSVIDCPMGRLFFAALGLCHLHRQQREGGRGDHGDGRIAQVQHFSFSC